MLILPPVAVTTTIFTSLVETPLKPLFATFTGWGVACVIICSDELPFCGMCTYVDMLL